MYKKSPDKNKLSIKIALRSLHIYRQLEAPQNIEFDIMCTMCDKIGAANIDTALRPQAEQAVSDITKMRK